ncbi:endonuclease domain-containing 1 protein-like isoform X2 [Onychostoma macrolepis]|uniref:endonuclease domain-containing 1 protein-like isoform X2 n=1 Tax=Onychostoma macrolepis TaxID=369639 RepID=UPI0027295538|nr:endonuclease domain-containing 1 protein-like isoform X2 [Onychostoma macrolepis]
MLLLLMLSLLSGGSARVVQDFESGCAYKFEGLMGCTRRDTWYIEPQIDDNNGGPNMEFSTALNIHIRGDRQALSKDYENSGYDRGHLAPVYLANSQSCAEATFTLTNAAPQTKCFNRVFWWEEEESLGKHLGKCHLNVYIVTGVVPGTNYINSRVNVPSHFWTAYCCLDQNNKCSDSGGVIGTNVNDSIIRKMSVVDLEAELRKLYGRAFQVFQYK